MVPTHLRNQILQLSQSRCYCLLHALKMPCDFGSGHTNLKNRSHPYNLPPFTYILVFKTALIFSLALTVIRFLAVGNRVAGENWTPVILKNY